MISKEDGPELRMGVMGASYPFSSLYEPGYAL